jgi:hypothetical protein
MTPEARDRVLLVLSEVTVASFGASDVTKHEGTRHIATDLLFGMEMVRQVQTSAGVRDFEQFISG